MPGETFDVARDDVERASRRRPLGDNYRIDDVLRQVARGSEAWRSPGSSACFSCSRGASRRQADHSLAELSAEADERGLELVEQAAELGLHVAPGRAAMRQEDARTSFSPFAIQVRHLRRLERAPRMEFGAMRKTARSVARGGSSWWSQSRSSSWHPTGVEPEVLTARRGRGAERARDPGARERTSPSRSRTQEERGLPSNSSVSSELRFTGGARPFIESTAMPRPA